MFRGVGQRSSVFCVLLTLWIFRVFWSGIQLILRRDTKMMSHPAYRKCLKSHHKLIPFSFSTQQKGPRSDNSKSNKIFVGGIPHNCGETELREYFKKFGVVSFLHLSVLAGPSSCCLSSLGFLRVGGSAAHSHVPHPHPHEKDQDPAFLFVII